MKETEKVKEPDKKNAFTVIDDKGNKLECEVLFTFKSDETEKDYIAYTDHSVDDKGVIQVFASIYDPEKPDGELIPIESDKEWKVINSILTSLQEQAEKKGEETEQ